MAAIGTFKANRATSLCETWKYVWDAACSSWKQHSCQKAIAHLNIYLTSLYTYYEMAWFLNLAQVQVYYTH